MKCRFRGAEGVGGGAAPPPAAHQIQRLERKQIEKQKQKEKGEQLPKRNSNKSKEQKDKNTKSRKAAKAKKQPKQKSNKSRKAAKAESDNNHPPLKKRINKNNAHPLYIYIWAAQLCIYLLDLISDGKSFTSR